MGRQQGKRTRGGRGGAPISNFIINTYFVKGVLPLSAGEERLSPAPLLLAVPSEEGLSCFWD